MLLRPPLFVVQFISISQPNSAHFNPEKTEVGSSFAFTCSQTCCDQYAGRMVTGDEKLVSHVYVSIICVLRHTLPSKCCTVLQKLATASNR